MNHDPNSEPTEPNALELAMLAALIDPNACGTGKAREALLRAMALFEESAALCAELHPKTPRERVESLEKNGGRFRKDGARRLMVALERRHGPPVENRLTLALHDKEKDTLRPYLQKQCNLEGKKVKKGWDQVRNIRTNLRRWIIARVNQDNEKNAPCIQARQIRDEEKAQARGCPVEELRADSYYGETEQWQDGEKVFEDFLVKWAVKKDGKPAGLSVPQDLIDQFITWRREIKQQGGVKAVRSLTREEVFRGLSKTS